MVLIECKRLPKEEYSKDVDVFCMTAAASDSVGDVTDALQTMQNTRVRLRWQAAAARALAKDTCSVEQQHHLLGPAEEAERYLALERAAQRQPCTQAALDEFVRAFVGAAMMLFPAECSGADACARLAATLDQHEEQQQEGGGGGSAATVSDAARSLAHRLLSLIDDGATSEATLRGPAVMWWGGKPLARDVPLSRYVGSNEKTKITVKLTPHGAAPPPREPAVDARAQAELMAHFYRKQEEAKKLMDDEDITFTNSEWANPRGLKKMLLGTERIAYKPSMQ